MSSLELKYTPDPQDEVSLLSVEAHSEMFSGQASCWVAQGQLLEFSDRLDLYPISERDPISLCCGHNQIESEELVFKIVLRPSDGRGNLVLEAEISDRFDNWSRVKLKFDTNYADVARFRQAMVAMLAGYKDFAKLEGCG
jgi:hypothetical protein